MAKRKPDKPKRGRGRPKVEVDAAKVERLIGHGATVEMVADALSCSVDTLERNCAEAIEKGRNARNGKLQCVQYGKAMEGNVTMLIWLGKQWLGQRDKTEQDVTTHRGEPGDDFRIAGKSRAEILQDLIERLKGETAEQQEQPGGEPGPEPQEVETLDMMRGGNGHQQVGNNGAANR